MKLSMIEVSIKSLIITAIICLLNGCNTVEGTVNGLGQDVQSVVPGKSHHSQQSSASQRKMHKSNNVSKYKANHHSNTSRY